MKSKVYKHSHIHNNNFEPDSAVFVKVESDNWKNDYDLEILATRYLGDNLYIIVSIPHFIYDLQRYDVVLVDEETDIVTNLKNRGRNTSARIIFGKNTTEIMQQEVLQYLVNMNCSIDPSNLSMYGIDLDIENSREILRKELTKLRNTNKILDWEYVIQ